MHEQQPMTKTMKATDIRQEWSKVLNSVARKETRVLVEKSGAPVAALVSAEDLRRLQELDASRERDFAVLDEMRSAFQDVPPTQIEDEVTRALDEVRAARRTDQGAKE